MNGRTDWCSSIDSISLDCHLSVQFIYWSALYYILLMLRRRAKYLYGLRDFHCPSYGTITYSLSIDPATEWYSYCVGVVYLSAVLDILPTTFKPAFIAIYKKNGFGIKPSLQVVVYRKRCSVVYNWKTPEAWLYTRYALKWWLNHPYCEMLATIRSVWRVMVIIS